MSRFFKAPSTASLLAVLLIVALFVPAVSRAEGPDSLWQTFAIDDGILSGNVLALLVSRDGSVWLGTDGGASHYNGRWDSVTQDNGLPSNYVRALAQTKDGALWFGTKSGLARRSPDGQCCRTWTEADGLPDRNIYALLASPDTLLSGDQPGIWVATAKGLVYIEGERAVVDTPVPGVDVVAIALLPDGRLLASAKGEGIWERQVGGGWHTLAGGAPLQGEVFGLRADPGGRVWAGTQNGLAYYQDDAWQRFQLQEDDHGLQVFAVMFDRNGGLWAGTDQGCFYAADPGSESLPVVRYRAGSGGPVNDYVRAMAEDQDGALWFATIAGISRYEGLIWQTIPDAALRGQRINALLTDSAGGVWVATEANGLAVWDGKAWAHLTAENQQGASGLPDNRIVTLFEDSAGRVWIGAGESVGFRDLSGQWQFYDAATLGLAGTPVYAFEQDAAGVLWLATERGLSQWSEATGFRSYPELAGRRVNAVHLARNGTLWVGTRDDGLFRLAEGQWQAVQDAGSASLNDIVVSGISETADGSLWLATYNDGLWRYRGNRWATMDAHLVSPKLLSLCAAEGNLWAGTRQGLARFDGRTWESYNGDVLPAPWITALACDDAGDVWIGTSAGLVRYSPERSQPWVKIESVNLLALQGGAFTLNSNRLQVIGVQGGDLSTLEPDLVYLTQLQGVDVAPRVLTDAQITAYADRPLAPGTHLLRVTARDRSFNYSEPAQVELVTPRFVTLPGGWILRADVFYPLLSLGVMALIALSATGRMGWRARKREKQLASEMATRQREAVERNYNPYISGEPIRHADMFFGRDELLQRIFNALHQNSIMIHGERRMGKTTLLYQLAELLRSTDDPEWVFVPVYIDLEGTPQDRFFHLLMESIWGALQAYLTNEPPELRLQTVPVDHYSDRDFAADLRLLVDRLKSVVAPRKVRIILLLDEMDVVSSYDTIVQQQLRRIFMSSLAANLGAVVAGIQISKAWDRLESPWYNMFNEIPLEPFPADQAAELLTEPVRGIYEWEPAALHYVLERAEGRPYRLQQYALEGVNQMLAAKRVSITLEDVQAAHVTIERSRNE